MTLHDPVLLLSQIANTPSLAASLEDDAWKKVSLFEEAKAEH